MGVLVVFEDRRERVVLDDEAAARGDVGRVAEGEDAVEVVRFRAHLKTVEEHRASNEHAAHLLQPSPGSVLHREHEHHRQELQEVHLEGARGGERVFS